MGGAQLVDAGPELIEREQESALLDALVMVSHPAEVVRLIEAAVNVVAVKQ